MDSFEINKVAGAVLGTLLFAFGTGFVSELIYTPKPAGNAGYALPGGKEGGEHGGAAPAGGGEAAAPKADGIATLLASADAEKGKGATKACQACHSFEKGGPNKVGPDLWDIVGRKKGSHEGFGYSEAMKAKGGDWGFEDLDQFLTKPGDYVKGTKMAFQGVSSASERANLIAYLRTLSESPKPLPAADKKEEGEKKAEGEKKPDAKPAEPTPAEPKKAEESKPAEAKPEGDKKADDAKPADGEKKAEDAKPAEPKPAEKAAEPKKAEESKPAEAKPEGDKKADDDKPADDAKPADGEKKAEDAKPAESKPEESKPAEAKPEGDETADDAKPADSETPAEQKPAEDKPAQP